MRNESLKVSALAALLVAGCGATDSGRSEGDGESAGETPATRHVIAFSTDRSGGGDLWAVDPESGELSRLTFHETADYAPRWSPALGTLVFAAERRDPVALYALPGEDAEIGAEPEYLFDNPAGEEVPDWSADGREIVFTSGRDGNLEIYLGDSDGEAVERLTRHPGEDKQPRFSPDARRIVYVSDLEGQQDLFVLDRDAGTTRNVTQHPALEGHPEWSPDGRELLFYRFENGDADLYLIASDGTGAATNVTRSAGNELVGRFSPDGTQIVFGSARDGDWELYLAARDGSDPRRLTEHQGFDGDPIFIPAP